jgi:hypothetical protein
LGWVNISLGPKNYIEIGRYYLYFRRSC